MLAEYIKPFTTWLHLHPNAAGLFTFFIAFTESLALIGGIVPGSVAMTAIGVLIGTGVIPIWSTFAWAVLGAILGDAVSFWIGYHFKDRLRGIWPFRKYPYWLTVGEKFFHKHGGKSIFIGRFVGPVRSILPIVAGMLKMPVKRFLIADVVSAFAWAPAYLVPGILLGAASLELEPETAIRLVLLVLGTLALIWLVTWLTKLSSIWLIKKTDRLLNRLWDYLRRHKTLRPLTILLQDPSHPEGHGQLGLAIFCLVMVILFLSLIIAVAQQNVVVTLNQPIFTLLQSLRTPGFDKIILGLTFFGDKIVLLGMLGLVFIWFAVQRQWWTAWHWLGNGLLVAAAVWVVKHIVQSPRPTGLTMVRASYSFPSGHMTLSLAIFGFAAVLFASQLAKRHRHFIYTPTVTFVLLIGLSRLYLGAHWLTDIIGGILLGSFCAMLATLSYRRRLLAMFPLFNTFIVALLSLLLMWGLYTYQQFDQQYINYMPKYNIHKISSQRWWSQQQAILPLYRTNRLGQAIAVMNIQWAAPLTEIKTELSKQGWQTAENGFIPTISRIAAKNKAQHLPVFNQLFENRAPVLVMVKHNKNGMPISVLRLWASHYYFTDQVTPLWIGSLHYRILPQHRWLPSRNHHHVKPLPPPLTQVKLLLTNSQWKSVFYPAKVTLKNTLHHQDIIEVLLIK